MLQTPAATPSSRRAAIAFLLASAFCGTLETVFIRMIGDGLGVGQILLVRAGAQILLTAVLGGMFTGSGITMLRTHRLMGHLTRGSLAAVAWWCYFMSFRSLDLPLATTISFSSQLWLLVLAWPVLGERVTPERAAMALLGFAGVVVAVEVWQPTTLDWRISYGLCGSFLGAVMTLITRSLSATERTITIMFYMALMVFLSAIPQAAITWKPISAPQAGLLVLLSLSGTCATYCMVEAYRRAEASSLAPYPYSRFVFAAILGFALFGDPLKPATMVGAVMIALSNVLPVLLARRRREATARAAAGDAKGRQPAGE
ncbi:DMT family transporter [Alsobacter sp. R-9]